MTLVAHLKKAIRRTPLRRTHVAALRLYGERHLLALTSGSAARTEGRILCYHAVGQPSWGVNDVEPRTFRRHIELALELGYRFVPAKTIAQGASGPRDLAITFDDGLRSVLTEAAPILSEYRVPWSLFVVSEWASGRGRFEPGTMLDWRELELVLKHGAEIGSHSASHPDFGKIDVDHATRELIESKAAIERHLGIVVDSFAIPLGQSANWTQQASEAARRARYETVYAQAVHTRPAGTVPRNFVTRFDNDRIIKALLRGAFDEWEEWV